MRPRENPDAEFIPLQTAAKLIDRSVGFVQRRALCGQIAVRIEMGVAPRYKLTDVLKFAQPRAHQPEGVGAC